MVLDLCQADIKEWEQKTPYLKITFFWHLAHTCVTLSPLHTACWRQLFILPRWSECKPQICRGVSKWHEYTKDTHYTQKNTPLWFLRPPWSPDDSAIRNRLRLVETETSELASYCQARGLHVGVWSVAIKWGGFSQEGNQGYGVLYQIGSAKEADPKGINMSTDQKQICKKKLLIICEMDLTYLEPLWIQIANWASTTYICIGIIITAIMWFLSKKKSVAYLLSSTLFESVRRIPV